MKLRINGRERDVPLTSGGDVEQLLHHLEIDPTAVVVEVNREIVTVEEFAKVCLQEDDVVELIQFVGGG
jgi:sulfur carrier protein